MSKATLDLMSREAWTSTEAVDAFRDRQLAEAERLDREIQSLLRSEGKSRYQVCLRLGRIRREKLWKVLNKRSFVRYVLDAKAAGSSREARQWADVADRLPELPALDAVFASGTASPSVIRELVPVATKETDAELARQAVDMTVEQACNEAKRLRGEPPTSRVSCELPLEAKAVLVGVVIAELSERLGRPVSMAEALVHLIDLFVAERAGRPARAQEHAQGSADTNALPAPRAQLHPGKCVKCGTHHLRGPDGWIALSPTTAAMNECDAEVVDEHGKILRTIPESVRRLVFARDGMVCIVPGCGATRGLHFHHEAPAGWRDVGADPEHLLLICAAHHRQRHEGWLTIEGTASTGRRFFRYGGRELLAKATAPTAAALVEVARVGNVDEVHAVAARSTTLTEVARVGNSDPSEAHAVAGRTLANSTAPAAAESDRDEVARVGNEVARVRNVGSPEVDATVEATLRALQLPRSDARAAIRRVRAAVAGPLTELLTLALRAMPAG